ncbi:RNA polymerase sigma factor [Engelhardtia mirabilis]|uniref:ECF RNA polymerase sigma factor SigD n=1 Tax=Engelhardtia mirabilis TaxID=2528011 RepID=A0A518BIG6_9BACT|nr:ECF RNA polymerase sigma factor SigD [Planctomycetes bacterium Pla133]QDV01082.1 ECF RNA polymerase sigma factor SigD [Planctomycetes bacterium Pla86]
MIEDDDVAAAPVADEVRAARSGDRAAFRRLLARFGPAAHGAIVALAGVVEAEDLMQDVCLTSWQKLDDLREPSRFGPWLLSIARNAARRSLRAQGSRVEVGAVEVEPAQLAGDDDALAATEVLAQLAKVPEAFREVLAMRLVDGLSGQEIAAATGRSHGAVRVALARGMERLRERLIQEGWRA